MMMQKKRFQVDKLPFFERFEAKGKAVICTESFEKWLQEAIQGELKDKQFENHLPESETSENIIELLNSIYETESSCVDPVLMKMQLSSIETGVW